MYCEKCGVQLPDNAKFCGRCGAKQEMKDYLEKDKSYETTKRYSFKTLLGIFVFCVVMLSAHKGITAYEEYTSDPRNYIVGTWGILDENKVYTGETIEFFEDGTFVTENGTGYYYFASKNEICLSEWMSEYTYQCRMLSGSVKQKRMEFYDSETTVYFEKM